MNTNLAAASAEPFSASQMRLATARPQRCARAGFAICALVGVVAILFLSACGGRSVGAGGEPAPTEGTTEFSTPPCKPGGEADRIAIVEDTVGGSGPSNRQALDISDLDALIEAMRCHGGELAVTFIDGRDKPLVRLVVDRLPDEPAAPSHDANPIRLRAATDQYTKVHAAWEVKAGAWEERTARALADFKARLQAEMSVTPPGDPDIWTVLRRVEAFFNEDRTTGTVASHPYVLLVSERERFTSKCKDITGNRVIEPGMTFTDDQSGITWLCTSLGEFQNAASAGQGNAGAIAGNVALPLQDPRIHIVVVKGGPGLGPLDELHPARFEQPGPALRSIESGLQLAQ